MTCWCLASMCGNCRWWHCYASYQERRIRVRLRKNQEVSYANADLFQYIAMITISWVLSDTVYIRKGASNLWDSSNTLMTVFIGTMYLDILLIMNIVFFDLSRKFVYNWIRMVPFCLIKLYQLNGGVCIAYLVDITSTILLLLHWSDGFIYAKAVIRSGHC